MFKKECAERRKRAIATQLAYNDVSRDEEWLCAQKCYIAKKMLKASATLSHKSIPLKYLKHATPNRRVHLLVEWLHVVGLPYQYYPDSGVLMLSLSFLPNYGEKEQKEEWNAFLDKKMAEHEAERLAREEHERSQFRDICDQVK